jgi:Zn-dependent protease
MARPTDGSVRLFHAFGIDVYLHWSWLIIAVIQIQGAIGTYSSPLWNVLEYVALFGIVLLHEFGHALACRSVGGKADTIVLWPLGGVAYVSPPMRPGAVLWSIAAGPLVNVALTPITWGLYFGAAALGPEQAGPDLTQFLFQLAAINLVLLIFNMLPVYPLDGGQIVQALLWFYIGRARSLLVVSVVGMVAAGGVILTLLGFAVAGGGLSRGNGWLIIMAIFIGQRAAVGFQQARALSALLDRPRHKDAACPSCSAAPLAGNSWQCGNCNTSFDFFARRGVCPVCNTRYNEVSCPDCGQMSPYAAWQARAGRAPAVHP